MMDYNEKFKSEKIKNKYPKNALYLSNANSLNDNDINNRIRNINQYIINSDKIKYQNYYNINDIEKEDSSQQNIYNENINDTNKLININYTSGNGEIDFSYLPINADNGNNLYNKNKLNFFRNIYNKENNYSLINNSVKNHIQKFLTKYEKISHKKGLNEIIIHQRNNKLINKLNKRNISEVTKELETLNDKKLAKNILTEREYDNKLYEMKDILNIKQRVFSQNKKDYQKEKFFKNINEINNKDNQIKKIEKEKLLSKYNLKKHNINQIQIKNIFNYKNYNNINLNEIYKNSFTLPRTNKSMENRKKFKIKSIGNSSNIKSTLDKKPNYRCKNISYINYYEKPKIRIKKLETKYINKYDIQEPGLIYLTYNNNIISKENTTKNDFSSIIKSERNVVYHFDENNKENTYIFNSPIYKKKDNIFNNNYNKIKLSKGILKINNKSNYMNEKLFLQKKIINLEEIFNNKSQIGKENKNYDFNKENKIINENLLNSEYIKNNSKNLIHSDISLKEESKNNFTFNYTNNISSDIKQIIKKGTQQYIKNNKDFKKQKNRINRINQIFYEYNKELNKNDQNINKINTPINNKKISKNNKLYYNNYILKTRKNLLNNNISGQKNKVKNLSINKAKNKSINYNYSNYSDILETIRLDLKLNNKNIFNNNPNYTSNDIVNILKDSTFESNNIEINNINELNNSIIIFQEKSNKNNYKEKALDLSHLNSVINSRFNYNKEKKYLFKSNDFKRKNKLKKINDHLEKKIEHYFCMNNLKYKEKNIDNNKRNKKSKKKKNNNNNKINYKYSINKNEKEKTHNIFDIKIKKKETKSKNYILTEENNYNLLKNESKIKNSINYYKNKNELLYSFNKEYKGNMHISKNQKTIFQKINNYNKISLNKKILTYKKIVPNLYNNLYHSRNNTNNIQEFNSLTSEETNKFSDSYKPFNNNNANNDNNNFSKIQKINNYLECNSFRRRQNKSLNYLDLNYNIQNNILNNNKLYNTIDNKSLNLNNYFLNKKIKNKMDEHINNNSGNESQERKDKSNGGEEQMTQEEIEIEENEEENDEEDEIQSPSREEKSNTNNTNTVSNINKINPKDKYLLELKENGLPDLPKNKILSCNIGSLINISIYNGLSISNNISLISDSFQMFPTSDFIENLIKETKSNSKNKNNLDNNYFENKVNSYRKCPSIINTKIFFQIICERAGNITFLFMYRDEKDNNRIKFTKPFYILVNPLIELNKNNINNNNETINNKNIIELTNIRMQTVISKNIGKLKTDFENYYEEASLLGYNFIHFKTLQSLSSSDNLYAIKDHNDLNDSLFTDKYKNINLNLSQDQKKDLFQNIIKKLKQKYNIGAITDVILTQTSTESNWILEHTECAYNLDNSPWLNAAYKLDEILVNYSNMFYNKKVSSSCAPFINNSKDLEEAMEEIESLVKKNNLEEYFLIPINEYMDKFKIFYNDYILNQDKEDYIIKKNLLINEIKKDYSLRERNNSKRKKNNNYENYPNELLMNEIIIYDIISQSCKYYGYKRYGVEMPVELISLLIIEKYRIKSNKNELINDFEFIQEIKNYINKINKEWLDKSKGMIKIALLNVKEFIRYQFIQLNRIGIKRQLIDSYFHVLDKNDPKKILLCNGWIMQSEEISNSYPDITANGTWYYFKRKVIIWKDTIKINYEENISKTPEYLLNYMTKYITYLSSVFEGLYIESLANLPIFILKYFIHKARQTNPNIILMTQLPTIDDEMDDENNNINKEYKNSNIQKLYEKKYSEELGINLFVHEIIWDCSNNELVKNILSNINSNSNMTEGKLISKFNSNLYSMSKRSDNKIYFGCYKYLRYHKPFCILYDLTQDNQSYYEKYNIFAIQSAMMGSIGMLDCAIGSTRGFDQLFPYQVSSQKEQRQYHFENYKIKNLIKKILNLKDNDNSQKYQEVIFELNINKIILNERSKKINIDVNNIKNVKLALSFHKWKPDIIMEKINKNLFMIKISLPEGKHYYKYVINDDLWVCDSNKPVEVDKDQNMNNVLNINIINSITINDITLLRCYMNFIRDKFVNKTSEIFLQKNNDLLCVIRMITNSKSLINNNIEDKEINGYKNSLMKSPYKNMIESNINFNNINDNMVLNKNNYNNINYDNENNINLDFNQLIKDELNPYEGYAIITRPTYNIIDDTRGKGEIIIPGKIDSIICSFSSNKEEDFEMNNFLDTQYLLGITGNFFFNKDINYLNHISTVNYTKEKTIIRFHSFPPNSVLILKFSLDKEKLDIIENLDKSIDILFNKGDKLVDKYELYDINKILYQTESEEREWSFKKRGTYEINIIEKKDTILKNEKKSIDKIKFIYSGFHQIMDIIKKIKRKERQSILFNEDINNSQDKITSLIEDKIFINSLYYDIAENDYLIDYLLERINNIKSFAIMNTFIKKNILNNYKQLPYHLKTIFFESIIISLYQNIIRISLQNIPFTILNFGDFSTALSLCQYQFYGQISSSSSFILDLSKNPNNSIRNISISKGIPHNTVDSQRMYFRDTLIAFKALFLISNSYNEGKNMLRIIASCLRHGLIPDFFDDGEKPRYNSRDTCWYFINAVKNYIYYTKDYTFLKEEIELIFTSDNSFNEHIQKKIKGEIKNYTLENIIHIIFQSHAKGIHFREWDYSNNNYFSHNSYQKKEGYNIDIELDPNTGFIYGGNYCNNGTWMNKLGNSIKGKNKGIPATPRPGANIEIIALIYSCLDFVVDMGNKNYFKYKSVELSNGMNYPYSQWKLLIKDSFEDEFFVKKFNIDISNNDNNNEWNNNQIKGNIYKDYKNKNNVNIYEFQLRPNFLIALYISPDLFTYRNIINSINNVELFLLRNDNNVIGLKTLDKTDKQYSGLYEVTETNNFSTSLGFNIHNGIEHSWLYGLYIILKIKYFFNDKNNNKNTPDRNENENQKIIKFASKKLIPIMNIIKNNKWFGIPEMTDELGNIIKDGNQSDIKAMAIYYELIEILSKLEIENDNDYSNEYIDNSNVDI